MKVVVIRSPKFLSGILRVIFKIKKEVKSYHYAWRICSCIYSLFDRSADF